MAKSNYKYKKYLTACILSIAFLLNFSSETNAQMLQPGEKLQYRVSYFGITLGYIVIITKEKTDLNGHEVVVTKGLMKSNPNIPFVDLHAIYMSWVDISGLFSRQFVGKVKLSDNSWDYHKSVFHYPTKKIHSKKFIRKKLFFDNTFITNKKGNDGLSLYFMARQMTKSKKKVRVLTIVDRDTAFTKINFMNKKTVSEIDAVDYKIKTVYFNGKADWTGVYGINGEFEGWFSDDEASVPILAKMKVYIGSINIELAKWKRNGWKPPKAKLK